MNFSKHKKAKREIDRLSPTINPKAKLPRGFLFWAISMQLMWVKQNQVKQ